MRKKLTGTLPNKKQKEESLHGRHGLCQYNFKKPPHKVCAVYCHACTANNSIYMSMHTQLKEKGNRRCLGSFSKMGQWLQQRHRVEISHRKVCNVLGDPKASNIFFVKP